jgi:aspartate 1-decarboxylase
MQRQMLTAKIQRATITDADLNYEGSLTIDKEILDAVDMRPYERVMVYNINNGERFDTYAIEGEPGSGVIGLNGAAARKGLVGDLIIIVTYASFSEEELSNYSPKIVLLNKSNKIKKWLHK